MTFSRILGTGSYLPERVMHNQEFEQWIDTSDAWIRSRTGIQSRHIAADEQTCADLAQAAAVKAIQAASLTAADIDLIVLATSTPDQIFPSTAARLQERLNVPAGTIAFDVSAACSGFIYALDVADRFIRTQGATRALVIGAEVFSRILNWEDRGTCILFGDGAGAVVIGAADEPGIVSTHLHTDGRQEHLLNVPWGVAQGYAALQGAQGKVTMKGHEVFKVAVRTLGALVEETLEANGLKHGDIDWLVPHQANIRIMEATAKQLNLPMERVVSTVATHGNTSAASIPLALDTAVRDGRIQRADLLLLEAFGAGFTWGSALIRY